MRALNFAPIKPNLRLLSIAVKSVLVSALLVNPAWALPTYAITEIGLTVSDINNKGQVAGSGVNSSTQGKSHAFRYTDGVGYEDLGVAPHFPALNTSTANGINDNGQVVGSSDDYSFRYTDGMSVENLSDNYCPSLDTCIGVASEINNLGQVIGSWYGNETVPNTRAVRFTDGLGKSLYGVAVPRDTQSFGIDINDSGQSVGYSQDSLKVKHAFRIIDGLGMEYLGSLGGSINSGGEYSWGNSVSAAFGINNLGQVTGQSSTANLTWHGFLYTNGIGMQDLGVLQGDDSSVGIEINDSGHIVGKSWSTAGGFAHPVLWTRPGCPEDLNSAPGVKGTGWILGGDIRAINNKGQIVGNGVNPAGKASGYRLTPIAAGGAPQCAAPPAGIVPPNPNVNLPTVGTTIVEPANWKSVQPLQACTSKVCKARLATNRKLLREKAKVAIKTQKAAAKAPNNAGKQAAARKARKQYDRVVRIIQQLHN